MMIYAMRFTACYRGEKRKNEMLGENCGGSFINMRKVFFSSAFSLSFRVLALLYGFIIHPHRLSSLLIATAQSIPHINDLYLTAA
jgi:hypothetical protein